MQFLWVLLISCVFSGLLMYAYGNYALITGETALYSFKKHVNGGKFIAIFIILGITFGQWNSLMGISANIIYEIFYIYFPQLKRYRYETVLTIAIVVIGVMYTLLWIGK